MAKVKNIVGKKYGRLTVIALSEERGNRNQYKWECICDCGTKKTVTGELLRSGKTKSCGCLLKESRELMRSKMDRRVALLRNLYSHTKTRYKKKYGVKNHLPFAEFSKLSQMNCHYCGTEPSHVIKDYMHDSKTKGRNKKVSDTVVLYNGLDRIDSDIGYKSGNVVPCCRACNVAKLAMSQEDFKEHIKKIYHHWAKIP